MSNEYKDWQQEQIQDLKLDLKKCINTIYNTDPNNGDRITFILALCQKYNITPYE